MGCTPMGRPLSPCISCIQELRISLHQMSGGTQARACSLFPLSRLQMKGKKPRSPRITHISDVVMLHVYTLACNQNSKLL